MLGVVSLFASWSRGAVVGATLAVVLIALAVIQPGGDPLQLSIDDGLTERGEPLGPSAHAPLGTDQLGRDVWSRVVAGARTSITVAALATSLTLAIGLAIGLVAGYAGGWIDGVLMRGVDLVLSFPVLLLAILLSALLHERALAASNAPVVLTLALVGWTTTARVIRGKAMVLARSEMVVAARSLGASPARIVTRYVLPNVAGAVVVVALIAFAQNLVAESVLSYLGLGPPPPTPTWGRMLYEGRTYYRTAPHLVLAPGLAIVCAVAAFHLLAHGARARIEGAE